MFCEHLSFSCLAEREISYFKRTFIAQVLSSAPVIANEHDAQAHWGIFIYQKHTIMRGNMSLSTQPIKGARDFYPEDMRGRQYIFNVWTEVCELFGYEAYDAPVLESTDLYLEKGSQEIINEQTYTFNDRGDRSLTIRTEMTPSVSRMVAARRQELAYPLRLYSIPQCWRYERMQRGRGREFFQLNVDLFGDGSLNAEVEMIEIADTILKKFGAKRSMYQIKLNSRKLVDSFLTSTLGLDKTQAETIRRLIDRMHKMATPAFTAQIESVLTPTQREQGLLDSLLKFLTAKSLDDLPEIKDAVLLEQPIRELMNQLDDLKITNAVFDPTLMRGFDYYTDIAFEVFDTDPDNNRSMFGGGRYDGLVGMFGVDPIPTIGFGMGDITLQNFLDAHKLTKEIPSTTELYLFSVGDTSKGAINAARELREMGVKVAVDVSDRKPAKKIKNAVKAGIRYALIIGEEELEKNLFTLKDLKAGTEEKHGLQRIVSIVEDYREN